MVIVPMKLELVDHQCLQLVGDKLRESVFKLFTSPHLISLVLALKHLVEEFEIWLGKICLPTQHSYFIFH